MFNKIMRQPFPPGDSHAGIWMGILAINADEIAGTPATTSWSDCRHYAI
jgi:hypothetical protein